MPKKGRERPRPGAWLPPPALIQKWILKLKKKAEAKKVAEYVQPIRELMKMVENDPVLSASTNAMFVEALAYDTEDPTGAPAVKSWDEFLMLLNEIMTTSPEFTIVEGTTSTPQGQVACPINAILDWPMGTAAGYATFSNSKFNKYMRQVLKYWGRFLTSLDSRYVLAQGEPEDTPPSIAWLSEAGQEELVKVAMGPTPDHPPMTFTEIFAVPDPTDKEYFGFTSWDAFFIREFNKNIRPLGDADIVVSCESAPLQYKTNVALSADFNMKGQPYSLRNMLNDDPLAPQFAGGIVYQAFLSALSYHRWHSPVSGVIEKAYSVDGFYYLESATAGIYSKDPDDEAQLDSQAFISSVQTRLIVFIRADDKDIGLMAIVYIGMAEVSGCELTVVEGQRVKKGQEIGMFHFGGSSHCIVFQRGIELDFLVNVTQTTNPHSSNVAVNSNLANVIRKQ
eukprot:g6267.t1